MRQIRFGFLGLFEAFRVRPATARVDHARAEHRAVEIVSDVVVTLSDLPRASGPLHVKEPPAQVVEPLRPANYPGLEISPVDLLHQQIQALAVPPTVHIGLAEALRELMEHARIEALVVDFDVRGPGAVQPDVSLRKEFPDELAYPLIPSHSEAPADLAAILSGKGVWVRMFR